MIVLYKMNLDFRDLTFLIDNMQDDRRLSRTMLQIADSTYHFWAGLAKRNLNTSRQAYLLGLSQPFFEGPLQTVIELKGTLPNWIENGQMRFSMHEFFLDSAKAKTSKDGHRYRAVRMRMSAPGTVGHAGQPMDKVYEAPGPMSKSTKQGFGRAHNALPGTSTAERIGAAVHGLAKKLRGGQSLGQLELPLLKPFHTTDPFSEMEKRGKSGQRFYVTFRTVSDRFPEKFQHPGFTARHFAFAAANHAQEIGPQSLKDLAESIRRPKAKAKVLIPET